MTIDITDQSRRVQYAGSGTGPYDFAFEVLEQTDIEVYKDTTLLALTTDYTVSLNADGTGAVTTVASMTGFTVTIAGARPYQRITDFSTGGDFFAATVNDELDSQQIQILQLREVDNRTLQAPVTDDPSLDMSLPAAADRLGLYLAFDASGEPVATTGTGTDNTLRSDLAASSGSNLIGTLQSGTGAVARTAQNKMRERVSVTDFGAVGDGVTDDTAAWAAAIAASNQIYAPDGTYLVDTVALIPATTAAQGKHILGQSRQHTILKARTSSTIKLLDVEGGAVQAIGFTFERFTLDMANMTDADTRYGLYTKTGWNCAFRDVDIINNGSNKLSYYSETGFYTSIFENVDFGSTTGRIKLLGVSGSDAVTTLTFLNCQFAYFNGRYCAGLNFFAPTVQGALDKFTLADIDGIQILGGDIEGTGTYLVIGSNVEHLRTSNELSGFSGTYSSGTPGSAMYHDFTGGGGQAMGPISQGGGWQFKDTPLTILKTAAALHRTTIQASNATDQQVDFDFKNDGGDSYLGMLSTGEAFVDARGAVAQFLQQVVGTTIVAVSASGQSVTGTIGASNKLYPGTDAAAAQTACGLYAGSGAPNNANGVDGDFYFRSDGTAAGNTVIYHRQGGTWVALTT